MATNHKSEPENMLVVGELRDPKEWFYEKYGIDILNERIGVIEHSGKDVVLFIQQYMCDNGFACEDWFDKI